MPAPFLPLRAQVGTPQRRPSKTPWDKPTGNINDAQLIKPTSNVRVPSGKLGRITLRYCTGAVFFPSAISSLTLRVGSNRSGEVLPAAPSADCGSPTSYNDDLMINDAGKHQVKNPARSRARGEPLCPKKRKRERQLASRRGGKKAAMSLGQGYQRLARCCGAAGTHCRAALRVGCRGAARISVRWRRGLRGARVDEVTRDSHSPEKVSG